MEYSSDLPGSGDSVATSSFQAALPIQESGCQRQDVEVSGLVWVRLLSESAQQINKVADPLQAIIANTGRVSVDVRIPNGLESSLITFHIRLQI